MSLFSTGAPCVGAKDRLFVGLPSIEYSFRNLAVSRTATATERRYVHESETHLRLRAGVRQRYTRNANGSIKSRACGCKKGDVLVRKGGFEPPRLTAPPPQDGASASSATSARGKVRIDPSTFHKSRQRSEPRAVTATSKAPESLGLAPMEQA